ncbi:MAG: hypothetical protein HYR84_03440, partial [Planctomycetes bacterium]|nr:hypothetical protein [Planctomycetota bacterium]
MLTTFLTMLLLSGDFASGPQVGDKLPDFKSHAHLGADAGKEFKILDKTKKTPTLLIFMHAPSEIGITRPGFQFLKPVDKYASENDKLTTHIVWVTADKDKIEGWLKKAENSLGLKSPVSICLEGGKDGPATYGLNDKVQITALVCKDDKVVANFALADPNANDSKKVIAAVAKVLGKDPPKEEKKEEKKKRKADAKSPELQMLMRKMIQKDNSEDTVKGIAADMTKWAGDDAKKIQELREYCRLVVRLQYGN